MYYKQNNGMSVNFSDDARGPQAEANPRLNAEDDATATSVMPRNIIFNICICIYLSIAYIHIISTSILKCIIDSLKHHTLL